MMRRDLSLLIVTLTMAFCSLIPARSQESSAQGKSSDAEPKGPMLVAPFTREEAAAAQKEWSRLLGTPVELVNSVGMKLVLIPPGEFLMGPSEIEKGRWVREHQHRVRITKPFYLSACEVTQTEYEKVIGTNPSYFSINGRGKVTDLDSSWFPVEQVSWEQAVEFCGNLSSCPKEEDAGRVYRLPTEAEWEYACRAGTTTVFHFGNQSKGLEANFGGNRPYGTEEKGPYLKRPTTVGSYAPNAFGLYDMLGNVFEWCHDWFDQDYYKVSPIDDPPGPPQTAHRVTRGGAWNEPARNCRSASRTRFAPIYRSLIQGFRVAVNPPSK